MSTKRKTIVFALVLVIFVGGMGVIVWQFYEPEKSIAGPISVIDDLGRNVTITKYPPKKIVSLAPSCTEILFALELGSKVVGVDELSDHPPEVQERVNAGNLTTVGSYAEISIETVVGLQPDLVLATGARVQLLAVERLEGLGIVVVVLDPTKIDGILSDILLVGKTTGQMDKAKTLATDMERKIQEIADKTRNLPRPRVYYEYSMIGGYWSFGSESFTAELIYKAGGISIFAGYAGKYLSVSSEEVLKANPEIIIIDISHTIVGERVSIEAIKTRPGWDKTYAVQKNQLYEIDETFLVIPGPRIVDGLEVLVKIIHPELEES